ncbi:group II intron maturase-specific domain-containing protein [Limnospira fusiformis]|uniref:group II intron maturase-specific domain-containing protein n=1 Tax=Limnospira fusiformis TaxID=54297 RepID=UPI00296E81E9
MENKSHKVKEVIKKHKNAPQAALIKRLNPIITGWARYYSGVVSYAVLALSAKASHFLVII